MADANTVEKGTMFPGELVTEMYSKVRGKSSIAKLIASEPIPFNGKDVFTFSMDNKVSVVGESGSKPAGGATVAPVQIRPIKVVYQTRVSDEFIYASDEVKLNYLKAFTEGFAKRLAEGLDEMMMHGVNPAVGSSSDVIGNNHMDYVVLDANKVEYTKGTDNPDDVLEEAIGLLEGDATGAVLAPTFRDDIAKMSVSGLRKYPEFAWGKTPDDLGGIRLDSNKTVNANSNDDRAIVFNGNTVKWGFAKDMPLEVIKYGDPDGAGTDLKNKNQVCLRSEAYIGWGFLDPSQITMVVAP